MPPTIPPPRGARLVSAGPSSTALPPPRGARPIGSPLGSQLADPSGQFNPTYATFTPGPFVGPDGQTRIKRKDSTDWRSDEVVDDPQLTKNRVPVVKYEPTTGRSILLASPEQIKQFEADEKISDFRSGLGDRTSNASFGQAVLNKSLAGAADFSAFLGRTVLAPITQEGAPDEANRIADVLRNRGSEYAAQSVVPGADTISSAGATLITQLPKIAALGPAGAALASGGEQYSSSLTRARDSGLNESASQWHAVREGAIETGTTLLFNKLGKYVPGLGGLETKFKGGSAAVKSTFRQSLKKAGFGVVGELGEEETIAILSAVNTAMSGVDPKATDAGNLLDTLGETALVTIATMGLAEAPGLMVRTPGAVRAWILRNPDRAEQVAAIEEPTRSNLAKVGLDTQTEGNITTTEERTTFRDAVRDELSGATRRPPAADGQPLAAAPDGSTYGVAPAPVVAKPEPAKQPAFDPKAIDPTAAAEFKRLTGSDIDEAIDPADDKELGEAAQWMQRRGRKVKFFRSAGANNSFHDIESGVTYINASRKGEALWYAVGHEYAHASGADVRLADLPETILDEARQRYLATAAPGYAEQIANDPVRLTREAVAVYMGEFLADPKKRAMIREQDPTLWQAIFESIRRFVGFGNNVPASLQRVLKEFNEVVPQGKAVKLTEAESIERLAREHVAERDADGQAMFRQLIDENYAEAKKEDDAYRAALATARKRTGLDDRKIDRRENSYKDRTDLPGFAETARELAADPAVGPYLGLSPVTNMADTADYAAELWEALRNPRPPISKTDEAIVESARRQFDEWNAYRRPAPEPATTGQETDDPFGDREFDRPQQEQFDDSFNVEELEGRPRQRGQRGRRPYTDFANPLRGTRGGDELDRTRRGMGDNGPPWARGQVTQSAAAAVDADPNGVRNRLLDLSAEGNAWNHRQFAEALALIARDAEYASTTDQLAAADHFRRVYTKQRSEAGSALRVGQEDLFQTPEGRRALLVEEMMDDSAEDAAQLERARAYAKSLGVDPDEVVNYDADGGPLLSNDPYDAAVEKNTDEDKAAIRNAAKDRNVTRALAAIRQVEHKIAARKLKFRRRMEAKGLLPTTPQGMAALVADPDAFMRNLREIRAYKNLGRGRAGVADAVYETWLSGILSGFKTHVVNTLGTPSNYVGHLIPRTLAAAVNAATGSTEGPQLGEFGELVRAFPSALRIAWSNAVGSARHERSRLDARFGKSQSLETGAQNYSIPGWLGRIIRAPGFGMLQFGDDFTRTLIAEMEVRALAKRAAIEQGIPAADHRQFIDMEASSYNSPSWQAAYEYSKRMAFQEKGGETRQKIVAGLGGVARTPGIRWVLPFKRTPVNMAAQFVEWTPLHFWGVFQEARGNVAAGRPWSYGIKEEFAKAAMGTLGVMAIAGFLDDDDERNGEYFGITTSSHPTNKNSFRFGDTYVSYSRLEPFGAVLASMADTARGFGKDGFNGAAASSFVSIGHNTLNKPVMRGLKQVTDLGQQLGKGFYDGNPAVVKQAWQNFAADNVASFVPRIISQFSEAASDENPYDRRRRQAAELLGLEAVKVTAQYDLWGNKKSREVFGNPAGDIAYKLLSPVDVTEAKIHAGDRMIGKWNAKATPDARFKLPELSNQFIVDGKKVKLEPEQFQRLAELSGKINAALFDAAGFDADNPTESQMESLADIFDVARDEAKSILRQEIAGGRRQELDIAKIVRDSRRKIIVRIKNRIERNRPTAKAGETSEQRSERVSQYKADSAKWLESLRRWNRTMRPAESA